MKPNISWKDKRIEAINKLSKKKGWSSSDTNPYLEEIHAIYESDARTLLEFKKEMLLKKVYSL
jgi:translation initiation factor IF-2